MTNLKEISNNIMAIEFEINNDESVLSELQNAVKAKRDKMLNLMESKNRIEILIDSLKAIDFNDEELKIALSELNIINGLIDFLENIPDPGSAPINDKIQYLAVDSIGVDTKRFQLDCLTNHEKSSAKVEAPKVELEKIEAPKEEKWLIDIDKLNKDEYDFDDEKIQAIMIDKAVDGNWYPLRAFPYQDWNSSSRDNLDETPIAKIGISCIQEKIENALFFKIQKVNGTRCYKFADNDTVHNWILAAPRKVEVPKVELEKVEPVAVEPVKVEPIAVTKPSLLDCLTNNEKSLDTLVAESGLQTEVVTSDLLMLELDGKVKQSPGLRFKLSVNFRKNDSIEVNPTEVNPTEVNPTEVSPTEVSPTEVSPTEVNPTEVSPTVDNIFDYSRDDISRQLATWAYSGSSYQPEKLADRVIDGYCDLMAEINNEFLEYQNPPSLAMKNDLEAFKQGYIQKLNAKLTADSKTISSFVTGAGNFPTRSNEKKLQSARKKLDDLLNYEEKRLGALRRLYNPKVTLPISADDDDALAQINQKIEREEATYSEIKKLSALVRKMDPENTDDSQWKMVCDLAKEIVAKDDSLALSRLLRATSIGEGIAKSHLQSYYRSIRRLKERAVVLKREQEFRNNSVSNDDDNDDANFKTIKFPGGEIIENYEENRLQICFDKIPSKETRSQLKGYGFRWAPSQKAWQRQLNDNARSAASQLLGVKLEFSWSHACAESLMEKDNGI